MILKCPNCGQSNRIPDDAQGKTVCCGKCKQPLKTGPLIVTDADFSQVVAGSTPVVVDFWAAWCGPCRMIAPVIESLVASRNDVLFAKLNVDENPTTQAKFRVSGIPTLIFFRNGEEKGRIVGAVGRPQIEQAIDRYFA